MEKYNPQEIENKWQKVWEEEKYGQAKDFGDKPKHYHLVEFPYPSGAGLHVGHCMGYGASDAYCRMKRMQGYNVMYPIGWDAFGLPTENYAIRTGIHPSKVTTESIVTFKKQIKSLGYAFDWDREINTTDPDYYRWTQWIFLQFYKHAIVDEKLIKVEDGDTTTPRLAYQKEMPINWCPSCKIGLANEEVIAGACERCGTQTEKRMQKQWLLRITAYADRLIDGLNTVDYLDKIKTQQVNWIGRSEGAEIEFRIKSQESTIKVFTTRADTLFGATFMVVAPEHPVVEKLMNSITNYDEVLQYVNQAKKKSDLERTELNKEKTGVEIKGIKAINPVNKKEIPIFVADYVLISYGTGAVMAVPAHDDRDWEFARKYNLEIVQVVQPVFGESNRRGDAEARQTITAAVRNKKGEFLMIKKPKLNWVNPVIGGIDEGETPEDAAVREVYEETGYKAKAIEKIGGTIESHFYNPEKKVWRARYDQPVLCELVDEEPEEVSEEESANREVVWLDANTTLRENNYENNALPIEMVIKGNHSYAGSGESINSDFLNGLETEQAKTQMVEWLETNNFGKKAVNYKLRDWIFSRQHYWGEPIPIVHCQECGIVPLEEKDLPLTLPDVENYQPTDTGESPLAKITDWVNTTCPRCGRLAKRETDTMPNWAGSSWYFLAYAMQIKKESQTSKQQENQNVFKEKRSNLDYWLPVDVYNGGMEHTTLHLLYSRFWHKFLFDLGVVPGLEPYAKRIAHGIILGPDGQKMSKSKGNVINPDDMVAKFGADTLRAYIMFIGPYNQESAWSMAGIQGVSRFLNRLWNNFDKIKDNSDSTELLVKLNRTIVGVTDDLENFRLNTVVSKLMEMNNAIEKTGLISLSSYQKYLKLLFPVAPHIAEELWHRLDARIKPDDNKKKKLIEEEKWPEADPNYLITEKIEIVVQINGKVRDKIEVASDISDQEMKEAALASNKVKEIVNNKEIIKTIVVPKKLVSIVLRGQG